MLALLAAALLLQAPSPPPIPRPPAAGPRAAAVPAPPPAPDTGAERGPLRGEWPAQPSGKRITLEDSASIDDALEAIAEVAGWNVVLNTGRTGNKTLVLRLRDVPVEDALRAALAGTDLQATRTGVMVVVAPAREPVLPAPPTLAGFEKPSGKKFTGYFERTPVGEALRKITEAGGLSLVLPPEGPGRHGPEATVTANFRGVPVEDALRAVLAQAGLTARLDGSMLLVEEHDPFARVGRDVRRTVDQAMREADRELRRAGRDLEDVHDGGRDGGRDRESTGEDVTISAGEVVRDVNLVKGNLLVKGGAVTRDVAVVFGSATLEPGAHAREVVAVLGSVKLAGGASARQVVAVGGDVEVGPGAVVEQDVISVGGRAKVDPEAEVGGSTQSISIPGIPGLVGFTTSRFAGAPASPLLRVVEVLVQFALLFVLGLLVISFFPRRLEAVAATMVASPWKSVLAGLLGTVALPVLMLLLIVTIVGILLVPVQILAVAAAGVLGVTALAFHLGRSLPLPEHRRTMVLHLALGTAIFVVLTHIPILGAMIWVATWLLTFGAVLRSRFGQQGGPVLPTTAIPPAPPAPPVAAP